MSAKGPLSSISQPVPELPVANVERAQQHYRDVFGFEIGWLSPDREIGAVSRGDVVIFLRKRKPPFEPAVHWVFAEDIDASYRELKSSGANVVEPLERKPWGLRQFTVADMDKSVRFWTEMLGFKAASVSPRQGGWQEAVTGIADASLMVAHLYGHGRTWNELLAAGATSQGRIASVKSGPVEDCLAGYIRDPNGIIIELLELKRT